MKYPLSFKVTPEIQTGDVYATEFEFKSDLPPQYTRFVWDLGDRSKLVYDQSKVLHTYRYPGYYTVSLSAWTDYGEYATDLATVDVDYPYRDSLTFTQIPSTFGVPGSISTAPFIVSLTSAKIDQPLSLVLHSYNSKSVPHYSVPDKWSFIIPQWRFKDSNENVLGETVTLSTTPIYKNGKVVAVKSSFSFYYVDDVSTGIDIENDCPLLVIVSLSTEGFTYPPESLIYPYASYSNNEIVQAVSTWQLIDCIPSGLKITENFISDVYPIKWANVPIPVMITIKSDSSKLSSYALAEAAPEFNIDSFTYPRKNSWGRRNVVNLALSSSAMKLLSGVHYEIDSTEARYFKNTDEYGNISTGYIFTSITPLTALPGDVVVSVKTRAVNADRPDKKYAFTFPYGYPVYYDAYISHSLKNLFYRISYAVGGADCPFVKYYKGLDILAQGTATVVPTPSASEFPETINNYTLPLTGHGNLYALSFNPLKNRLYGADIDFNTIKCYRAGVTLLTSVNLQQMFGKASLGPTCISIDNYSNVWVSLFDDRKILKFDYKLNYLLSAAPQPEFNIPLSNNNTWLEPRNPTFSPPVLETDKDSNVWVCYPNHEMPSRLYKFDTNGTTLLSADLPKNAVPISLSIGNDNSVWVACKHTNEIISFKEDGTRLESDGVFTPHLTAGIIRPSYICHDRDGNLCILHGYNLYSYYNMYTDELKTWEVDFNQSEGQAAKFINSTNPIKTINYDLDVEEVWGGINCDVYNRVWFLDSVTNQSAVSLPRELSGLNLIPLDPKIGPPYHTYIIKGGETTSTLLSVTEEMGLKLGLQRSVQAGGDWTGNRWYQKYGDGLLEYDIEGTSSLFNVYDLEDSFKIAKVNETWSYVDYFKSLAFPEVIQSNENLLKFLGAAIGDDDDLDENIGSTIHERIANFVENHGDVTTAGIDALQSIAKQMGMEVKDYVTEYPSSLKKLIDLFSIDNHYLRGIPNKESDPRKKIGELLNPSIQTGQVMLTADRFYLLQHKQTNTYRLFYATKLGELDVYSSDLIQPEGLLSPLKDNYYIFTYNDELQNETTPWLNNIIDWTSPLTTLTYSTSSHDEWYGDEGIMDIMFNNLLTKQLFGK